MSRLAEGIAAVALAGQRDVDQTRLQLRISAEALDQRGAVAAHAGSTEPPGRIGGRDFTELESA